MNDHEYERMKNEVARLEAALREVRTHAQTAWARGHEEGRNTAQRMTRNALDAVSRAQQEAAAHKEASDMLDWLASQQAAICRSIVDKLFYVYWTDDDYCQEGEHETPRDAIRAAMKSHRWTAPDTKEKGPSEARREEMEAGQTVYKWADVTAYRLDPNDQEGEENDQ